MTGSVQDKNVLSFIALKSKLNQLRSFNYCKDRLSVKIQGTYTVVLYLQCFTMFSGASI